MPNGTATLTLESLQYLKRCFMGINADGDPLGYEGTMEIVDKIFDILDPAIAEAKRELTDAVRGLSHAQLGVIRAVISVPHPNETPQLASAREQALGWLNKEVTVADETICFRCEAGIARRPTGTSNTDALVWEYEHYYWDGQTYTMPCYESRRHPQKEG